MLPAPLPHTNKTPKTTDHIKETDSNTKVNVAYILKQGTENA